MPQISSCLVDMCNDMFNAIQDKDSLSQKNKNRRGDKPLYLQWVGSSSQGNFKGLESINQANRERQEMHSRQE